MKSFAIQQLIGGVLVWALLPMAGCSQDGPLPVSFERVANEAEVVGGTPTVRAALGGGGMIQFRGPATIDAVKAAITTVVIRMGFKIQGGSDELTPEMKAMLPNGKDGQEIRLFVFEHPDNVMISLTGMAMPDGSNLVMIQMVDGKRW
jgi:hypothetical protein